jgi:hypothetical protein
VGEFRLGDEVLAPWLNDGWYYPAVIVALGGPVVHVAYLDGDEGDVPIASLRRGVLGPGLRVQVNWKGRRSYYGGVIRQRVGMAVAMSYDDGSSEWATIVQCRVEANLLQTINPAVAACSYCGAPVQGATACPNCGATPGRLA